MTALTREALQPVGCATPNCHHDHSVLYVHSKCHAYAPVEVSYEKASGHLIVQCSRCKQVVACFQVA